MIHAVSVISKTNGQGEHQRNTTFCWNCYVLVVEVSSNSSRLSCTYLFELVSFKALALTEYGQMYFSHFGVSLEDLTKTGPGQYDITHEIGRNAKEMGYKGIVAPSARNPGGANVIVFGGF